MSISKQTHQALSAKKRSTHRTSPPRVSLATDDDATELSGEELHDPSGVWRIGETVVSSSVGSQALRHALVGKTRVNIHLDNDVIAYFKTKVGGRGYQTLINAALRELMNGEMNTREIQQAIRQAVREEFLAQRAQAGSREVYFDDP